MENIIVMTLCTLLKNTNTYIVGGFLRDNLLNLEVNDLDLVTFSNKEEVIDKVQSWFICNPIRVGPVVKFLVNQGSNSQNLSIDLTQSNYENIEEDLLYRDFTCNSLALRVDDYPNFQHLTGLDSSKEDIMNKVINLAHPRSLEVDPVRILRAYYLKGRGVFSISSTTLTSIKNNAEKLIYSPKERVKDEFWKILSLEHCLPIIRALYEHKVLEYLIPEVSISNEMNQGVMNNLLNTLNIYENKLHELLETSPHSAVLKSFIMENNEILKLGCLLHIIKHSEDFSQKLNLSKKEANNLNSLVQYHTQPLQFFLNRDKITASTLYWFFNKDKDFTLGILLLSLCHFKGIVLCHRDTEFKEFKDFKNFIFDLIGTFLDFPDKYVNIEPLLNGAEIQKILGVAPSPLIGKIKTELIEQQLLEAIQNKREAVIFLKNRYIIKAEHN